MEISQLPVASLPSAHLPCGPFLLGYLGSPRLGCCMRSLTWLSGRCFEAVHTCSTGVSMFTQTSSLQEGFSLLSLPVPHSYFPCLSNTNLSFTCML